jgi:hypothetical protein
MKQVICMKWGQLYGAEYVNRLFRMIRRRLTGELRFVCLTDDPAGLLSDIEIYDCPSIDTPAPHCFRGWRKLSLYAPSEALFGLTGTWLYLDLDVVITGSLDPFFTHAPLQPFVVMKNWSQPGSGIGNTSVFRFEIGHESYLLDNLLNNHAPILNEYSNSQTYISRNLRQIEFWPDDWCALFKVQCIPAWPARFWQAPKLPPATRVVAFPGVPNPHEAMAGKWPVKHWWKRSYKTIKPAPWIAEHWH